MSVIRLSDYMLRPVPPKPLCIVDGLVPAEGKIMLVSPAKQGKSTLALQLAAAVGSGTPFLNRETTKGRVLYLQFDNVEHIWRSMLERGHDEGLDYSNISILDPSNLPPMGLFDLCKNEWFDWLDGRIKAANPALIIVDVFRKLHRLDENKSLDMTNLHNILNRLTKGRSVVILHHTTKFREDSNNPRPIASHAGRGSGVISGDADGTWFLFRSKMTVESRLDEDTTIDLVRSLDGFWRACEDTPPHALVELKMFMDKHSDIKSNNMLAKLALRDLKISRRTFYRRLQRLRKGDPGVYIGTSDTPHTPEYPYIN